MATERAQRGASLIDALAARRLHIWKTTDFRAEIKKLWREGLPPGDRPGWKTVDELYTVVPGQFTVVTGWPGSGKSEWLDHMLVHLAFNDGWRFAIHSPENQPVWIHIAKLMEKVRGKPFGQGMNERIAESELDGALEQLVGAFSFLGSAEGTLSIEEIITAAAPHLGDSGKRGLVLDPWNELEHWRPEHLSETEYVSLTLSKLRNWARATGVHVFIVAHPQKMKRTEDGQLPVPRPDMISGSAHWWNKPDNSITVWRDQSPAAMRPEMVLISVTKIRFKHVGRVGETWLRYDRITGQYFERDDGYEQRGVQFPT